MPERLDLIGWGKPGDGQGARLAILIALACLLGLGIAVFGNDQGEPAQGRPYRCAAEDEVVVEMTEEAYGMASGSLHCVHVDAITRKDQP